ncbi:hypothetical protein MWU54_08585 [Marivita sp. S6314]|uniref:hypothetical protein n=1 Tax=Marivita sp. S6314 TaxID=2926406 RepID=UPI001FF1D3B9|nr:hypothetical protein [Marivita sp. S6314]MCK0150073.1 hypothetical protein [Marivita sp. S6314]
MHDALFEAESELPVRTAIHEVVGSKNARAHAIRMHTGAGPIASMDPLVDLIAERSLVGRAAQTASTAVEVLTSPTGLDIAFVASKLPVLEALARYEGQLKSELMSADLSNSTFSFFGNQDEAKDWKAVQDDLLTVELQTAPASRDASRVTRNTTEVGVDIRL